MTDQEKSEILEGAKQAFFKAMLDGYAGGENRKSTKTTTNNGHTKTIRFVDRDYMVVDEYHTTHSDFSAGTTTIFNFNKDLLDGPIGFVPVWWMSYGGRYPEEAIPFLKLVLRQAYEQNLFCCGRGPHDFIDTIMDMEYENFGAGDFERFQGTEEITNLSFNKKIGFHKYFGMSLL